MGADKRVIAIRDINETEANIYGYGEYVGDEPCPYLYGIPNPKIVLDDGGIIWGCQCWWGNEDKANSVIANRKINVVPLPEPPKEG